MTGWQMFVASLWRFGRVLAAQAIGFWAAETSGLEIPYLGISVGALINMGAKFLRDKYKWDWLLV